MWRQKVAHLRKPFSVLCYPKNDVTFVEMSIKRLTMCKTKQGQSATVTLEPFYSISRYNEFVFVYVINVINNAGVKYGHEVNWLHQPHTYFRSQSGLLKRVKPLS